MANEQARSARVAAFVERIRELVGQGEDLEISISSGMITFGPDFANKRVGMDIIEGGSRANHAGAFLTPAEVDQVCDILQAYKQIITSEV